jgi:type II secretory ATPase GspE/PulE/Tfp pilus assembly ATPase PilB-like protein
MEAASTLSGVHLSIEYQARLYELTKTIHEAESFLKVLPFVEKEMLALLRAERLTVYRRTRHDTEIVSTYKTGNEIQEIRVPLSPMSIAGFVALSQHPVMISNVHDRQELAGIHPQLHYEASFDEKTHYTTRSMMVIPIKFRETALGVLQIINHINGPFTEYEMCVAAELAQVIGQKFQYDFQATQSPFDYLLHRRLITEDMLEELKNRSVREKISLPRLLITEMKLSPEEIGESLERYYQVPFLKYDPALQPPAEIMKYLKKSYLVSHLWVPLALAAKQVTILIDDPNDFKRIMEINQALKQHAVTFDLRVGIPEDILRYLGEAVAAAPETGREENLGELLGKLEGEAGLEEAGPVVSDTGDMGENEATIVRLVNRLIVDAARFKASDIHIEPRKGKESAVVRMRIDGECRELLKIPAPHIRAVISRIKIMSRLDIAERRKPQDGKISVKIKNQNVDLRVAVIPTVDGESAVLRLLASGEQAVPFNRLNFSERNERAVKKIIEHPHGIFLVVGPTGSGKTTTLHAILSHINTPDLKIWTAEDPVEITQPGLQQVQVQPAIGFGFAAAMRAFLRADPHIILIGEMRDRETSHIGIEASLTGHLVFSTLHTNSAPETISRLLGLELDPLDFADALLGILAQRLLRTLCDCRQKYRPTEEDIAQLRHMYGEPQERFNGMLKEMGDIQLARPVGCERCGRTGYRGRTGIHELLVATPEVKKLIVKTASASDLRDLAIEEGMTTLMQDGIWKVLRGQSDIAQLRKVVTV